MDKKLYFIRHIESEANRIDMQEWKQKTIASWPQVPPSAYGKESAQTFSQSIKNIWDFHPWNTLLISGTQERSKYLADILSRDHGFQTLIHSDYNERDFGIFGGSTKQELIECILSMNVEWLSKDTPLSDILDHKNAMPGRFETNKEVQQRLQNALWRDIQTHPWYNNYIIITSTGIIRNVLSSVINAEKGSDIDLLLPNNSIPNLSMTELYYNPQDGSLYLWNPPVIAKQWTI